MQSSLTVLVPDLLLKLAILDTPEEIFRYLKKHKLIYPGSHLAHIFGASALMFDPFNPIVTMPTKELLATFPELAHPELAGELAFIKRMKKLGKPGIMLGDVPFIPKTLKMLNPVDRLVLLHELGHIQSVLKRPKLYKFMTKSPITRALHEYFTHRKALKWLKTPLPEQTTSLTLRYPSIQAFSHLEPFRRHILPILDYIELRQMLKNPETSKLIRSRLKSPQFKQMLSQVESKWLRTLYKRLVESASRKATRPSVKPSFAGKAMQLFRRFFRR